MLWLEACAQGQRSTNEEDLSQSSSVGIGQQSNNKYTGQKNKPCEEGVVRQRWLLRWVLKLEYEWAQGRTRVLEDGKSMWTPRKGYKNRLQWGSAFSVVGKEKACMKNLVDWISGLDSSLFYTRIIHPFPCEDSFISLDLGFGLGHVTCFD